MLVSTKKQTREKSPGVTLSKKDSNALLKKIGSVSDSTKALSRELKSMSKIFAENQKVLVSMKDMIDSLTNTLEQIQKQSKQINIIEEDTQKLFSGLNQVRAQAGLITKVSEQANRLQEQVNRIVQAQKETPDPESIMKAVEESKNSIQNNTHMIIKMAQRIDNIKEDLENISSKADASKLTGEIASLKQDLAALIADGAAKAETITHLRGEIQKIESEIGSLIKRADSTAFVGEGLKSVQSDLSALKENVYNKTNTIDQKISSLSEMVKRSEASMAEFHKKADKLFVDMQQVQSTTTKSSEHTSKEVVSLLKLSEYQSNMRILAESKYGDIKDIEKMAEQTASIVNLFDSLAIETQQKVALPQEVRQWAISKMLDCADKWEIRFSDLFGVLINKLGKELVKENIRLNQVRDIFGIRGVDEIRKELNLQSTT
ncbi:MAG TPA: chemotaxis protein [Candidatus Nitrosotenuis sp.]|nr:chemotaxis protein [Candidatus Nitrosotenuis sp.]